MWDLSVQRGGFLRETGEINFINHLAHYKENSIVPTCHQYESLDFFYLFFFQILPDPALLTLAAHLSLVWPHFTGSVAACSRRSPHPVLLLILLTCPQRLMSMCASTLNPISTIIGVIL